MARKLLSSWFECSVVVAHKLNCPSACGILVLQPGVESMSPVARQILSHCTTREDPFPIILHSTDFISLMMV